MGSLWGPYWSLLVLTGSYWSVLVRTGPYWFFLVHTGARPQNKHPNPHLITPVLEGTREEPKELLESDGDREEGAAPHATPTVGGESPPGSRSPWLWPCTSCTFLNVAPAVLCAVCERPRLAPRPPPAPQNGAPQRHIATYGDVSRHGDPSEPGDSSRRDDISQYMDISRHIGSISRPQGSSGQEEPPGRGNLSQYGGLLRHKGPSRHEDPSGRANLSRYGDISRYEDAEQRRQEKLRRDGMRTVQMVREAESQSVPVEAVLGLAQAAGGGAKGALLRARAALGAELRLLMTSSGSDASGPALKEAAVAWIRARGSPALALQGMMGERRRKLRTLLSLGFPRSEAEPALHHVGWSLRRALPEVQRRKLHPFLSRLWEPEEPPLDFGCGDQQALARRALATLSLPSWGRATLFVAMGRELGLSPGSAAAPGLKALLEAVRSCADRAQIRRRLRCDCAVCGWALPREQMRWLTGCECALCPECFRQHFTIGVKEKAVADLVCPACGRPDLRDEAARLCYFSTLDVQVKRGA
ncbi:E3 ubiquitin-protein ligase RNF31-like isoform X2 [Phasianus colchicus]|uniref:E3 ubiquitin-protein ligase RNF31-like isoform X2 n=1 Tax=Phasianus colchicus TaxID=9054 RepID=UPI00129D58B6|nr:E3 ubiquitin-protein ligase RNF31-like isoform X2 [Phasianus colchicus]